jgi:bifunctional NMN adenylyltransferase/nudix hydrolase
MKKSLGVIVGRFQTAQITPGHQFLFDEVYKKHDTVVTFVGSKPPLYQPDEKNPLDFFSRKKMLMTYNPNLSVLSITDKGDDESWSDDLDKKIDEIRGTFDAILYGSRDSFISHYTGKFKTVELESNIIYSATSVRERIIQDAKDSDEFRAGVIYGLSNRIVSGIHCSYGLIVDSNSRVLIGKRKGDKYYSLFGGMYSPEVDKTYSDTMKRTIREQLGSNIEIGNTKFLFDTQLEHWAYSSSNEKVHGNFFICKVAWGYARPNHEFEFVEWVTVKEFENKMFSLEFSLLKDSFLEELES